MALQDPPRHGGGLVSPSYLTHDASGELYVVTSGEYGSEAWTAAPIGMADVYQGMAYRGTASFVPCTNPRTLEAWRARMIETGRPDCAALIKKDQIFCGASYRIR